ncbi:DUF1766-domain-containing protein [Saitoella complicata NRRL Y-17804]|uniref:Bacteriophage T5 Orf172 DNA-binding domain-containing protein n=1 Tax=Saitoella complicata (strain BCRC 22490 / CBS 7301 / JCM 7358 / NBRC 10748 / NRRL Y-17804) TaxID=698492 RepID=A0A0E9NJQ0_SAICN|nr:DUF1766-domain-containing protein [Saitoella complicata NRRL Y-17804]ODQ54526.1 DUF1766-domain-containing protein [Saitoella complicata NRRL Y-17804]GAO50107.1 hypothetical protein G7K_4242-t1 [Saitoella complicata NRRL Y-17804]
MRRPRQEISDGRTRKLHFATSPEHLASGLSRKDSKHPALTCHAVAVSSGKPCRRALPVVKSGASLTPEDKYCFQHKDHAKSAAPASRRNAQGIRGPRIALQPMSGNSDIRSQSHTTGQPPIPPNKPLPPPKNTPQHQTMVPPKRDSKVSRFFRKLCCMSDSAFNSIPPTAKTALPPTPRPGLHDPRPPSEVHVPLHSSTPEIRAANKPNMVKPRRPAPIQSASSTVTLPLSALASLPGTTIRVPGADGHGAFLVPNEWIDPTLSVTTRRALLSELEKPISAREEPGYIYVFRLQSPIEAGFQGSRALYKIGRTTNLQRRLYQWSNQCSLQPILVAYYPSPASSASSALKVSISHRVERLIHIELADKHPVSDKAACEACGRVHREWFEAETGRVGWEGIKTVILKWVEFGKVGWGEVEA